MGLALTILAVALTVIGIILVVVGIFNLVEMAWISAIIYIIVGAVLIWFGYDYIGIQRVKNA